ncbi:MAG: hypothetical protein OXC92_10965 [Flavobacteriaceae bacterium]|nr:hypothetical protein [Flavobacteriaceae bacterium]
MPIRWDEKAIQKGPGDATILSDSTQGTVLDLVERRKITPVQDRFRRPWPKKKVHQNHRYRSVVARHLFCSRASS